MKHPEKHPSLELLELYLLHRVNQTEEQEIEEHLLVCDRCRLMATALEYEINLIKSTLGFLQCTEYAPVVGQMVVAS